MTVLGAKWLWVKVLVYAGLAYSSFLMCQITLQYIPIDFDVAFLRVKQEEVALIYYRWAFFAHVYVSLPVLLLGGLQWSAWLRRKLPSLHRWAGRSYVALILALAAPSGLVMGWHANGGFWSQLAFVLLSLLWAYFTYRAWLAAKQQRWAVHRAFMYRSYALTLSAISLRFFKWLLVALFQPPPMDTYRIVAWLGWLVNLAVTEWLLRSYNQRRSG